MSVNCIAALQTSAEPDPEENVLKSLLNQYGAVVVESIVVSFGMDFLLFRNADQHGGDVDTINNVRKIGDDPLMDYKNNRNRESYDQRGAYVSSQYHQDKQYIARNREIRDLKKEGKLVDAYTGDRIAYNGKSDLDHVISAKEIHDDRGRVLARLKGTDLANSNENLQATNPHTNRTKKADSMEKFLDKYGGEYTSAQYDNMRRADAVSRESYEAKLRAAYYTSREFMTDTAIAAGKVALRMGIRQMFGFVFLEIWFAEQEEFQKADCGGEFDFAKLLANLANGVKRGIERAREKYKEMFARLGGVAVSGALASISTTLCNIFFTTSKNAVKIIRQTWASLIEAAKVLLFNPDDYLFGERFRAAAKIIAAGASVVLGRCVEELVSQKLTALSPELGNAIQTCCGILVTGIMSCTLVYALDHSKPLNRAIEKLNTVPSVELSVMDFKRQAALLEQYAAELMQIDLEKFKKETEAYSFIADRLERADSQEKLNQALEAAYALLDIPLPWKGDFDTFMLDKTAHMVFE